LSSTVSLPASSVIVTEKKYVVSSCRPSMPNAREVPSSVVVAVSLSAPQAVP
jgi:hypothetical protein